MINHLKTCAQKLQSNALILLILVFVLLGLHTAGPEITAEFIYQRADVLDGQWWRLMTANLVHFSFYHLSANILGLGLIWSIGCSYASGREMLLLLVLTSLCLCLSLLVFYPNIAYYGGLSGALHGLMVYIALCSVARKEWFGGVLMIGVITKIIHENLTGASELMAGLVGAPILLESHRLGALLGMLLWIIFQAIRRFRCRHITET